MEKLKVFIFESHYPDRIEEELRQIISLFNLKCEVSFTDDYDVAKEKISKEKFDIVSLCDLLDMVDEDEARRFVTTILALNSNTIIFFMLGTPNVDTFKFARANNVGLVFSCGRNFGMPEVIFHPDDVVDLKKAIIKKLMIDFTVPKSNLSNPICVFSQTYIASTPFEKMVKDSCDLISIKLSYQEIRYAVVPHDSHVEIWTGGDRKDKLLEIALNSGLKFWYDYVKKNIL